MKLDGRLSSIHAQAKRRLRPRKGTKPARKNLKAIALKLGATPEQIEKHERNGTLKLLVDTLKARA